MFEFNKMQLLRYSWLGVESTNQVSLSDNLIVIVVSVLYLIPRCKVDVKDQYSAASKHTALGSIL